MKSMACSKNVVKNEFWRFLKVKVKSFESTYFR